MQTTKVDERRRVLVLGGNPQLNQQALDFESRRNDGHDLFFARCIADAWSILKRERIDQIAIEAFMDNKEHETPFHFLRMLKASPYGEIPVVVIAAEPSIVGVRVSNCVERATMIFGARFISMEKFSPAKARPI